MDDKKLVELVEKFITPMALMEKSDIDMKKIETEIAKESMFFEGFQAGFRHALELAFGKDAVEKAAASVNSDKGKSC